MDIGRREEGGGFGGLGCKRRYKDVGRGGWGNVGRYFFICLFVFFFMLNKKKNWGTYFSNDVALI